MTITDQRLTELAAEAVVGAIQDLVADAMGLSERIYDEPGVSELGEVELSDLCDRFEAAIRKHLPAEDA